MFGLRGQELLIILLIVIVLFGAAKLPELARSLGSSAREFRKGIEDGVELAMDADVEERPRKPQAANRDDPDKNQH